MADAAALAAAAAAVGQQPPPPFDESSSEASLLDSDEEGSSDFEYSGSESDSEHEALLAEDDAATCAPAQRPLPRPTLTPLNALPLRAGSCSPRSECTRSARRSFTSSAQTACAP